MNMNLLSSKILEKFSENSSETEQYLVCSELTDCQRSFKWNEWEFGMDLFDRPYLIQQLSETNLLRTIVVIVERERLNPGFFSNLRKSGILYDIINRLRNGASTADVLKIKIDPDFDFRSDTGPNKDPDQHSYTLRQYHKALWSKRLPNKTLLDLSDAQPGKYLYHKSELGEFNLTSDCISHSYRNVVRMKSIVDQVPHKKMQNLYNAIHFIGGYTLFPGGVRQGFQTINQARGCNHRIVDRFDLTLECIRRYYLNVESPLKRTFEGYGDFFTLFENFEGYVNFFNFQDLVSDDLSKVKFFMPFDGSFAPQPFPKNLYQYYEYIENTRSFINNRTNRIIKNFKTFN